MQKRTFSIIFYFFSILVISGCFKFEQPYSSIAPGPWRAVLKLEKQFITPNPKGKPLPEKLNLKFEEVTNGELPLVFEVVYVNEKDFNIVIKNGEERITLDQIKIGHDITTGRDTILIDFPVFDTQIRAIYEERLMEGEWLVNNRSLPGDIPYRIPFVARQGQDHRFTTLKKEPIMNISGRWEATFEVERDTTFKAIGEFKQTGNYLEGTFLTETGDYRYLEGEVQANKAYLSCFDGSHAFLFEAKINPDSTLIGAFKSGLHYQTLWEARKNPDFKLQDPYQITSIKPGVTNFNFAFENENGQLISLNDPAYQNKAKIIQIMGTWCPNCRDETEFLVDYLKRSPAQDIKVVAIAFERRKEKALAQAAIKRFKEKLNVPYQVVLAGLSDDKTQASEILNHFNAISAFPILLFLDKNNTVQKIHTGFAGPATSEYEPFKKEFEKILSQITGK